MKLVVHDASILIDLALSETVDAWFASGIETWTTDLIFPNEIDRLDQRAVLDGYVQAGKLLIRAVTPDEIVQLGQVRSGLTIQTEARADRRGEDSLRQTLDAPAHRAR